jgi:hypothetical protein
MGCRMSYAMMILFKKGEAKKFRSFCDQTFRKEVGYRPDFPDYKCVAPPISGNAGDMLKLKEDEAICWIELDGYKLSIEYTAHPICHEWAVTIGKEVIKHFKVKKAGWDSIGYCPTVDEVMTRGPFKLELMRSSHTPSEKAVLSGWKKTYEEHAHNLFRSLDWPKYTTNLFRELGKE